MKANALSLYNLYKYPRPVFSSTNNTGNDSVQGFKIEKNNMMAHINALCTPETQGREVGEEGIKIAEKYITEQYKIIGLKPLKMLGLNSYYQLFSFMRLKKIIKPIDYYIKAVYDFRSSNNKDKEVQANNILGMIQGTENTDEYLIISAHFDHMGTDTNTIKIFPGADDDASGIAAMIEMAKYFKKNPPKKNIIFAALSGEESWGKGAEAFSDLLIKKRLDNKVDVLNIELLGAVEKDSYNLELWFNEQNTCPVELCKSIFNIATNSSMPPYQSNLNPPKTDAFIFAQKGIRAVTAALSTKFPSPAHPQLHTNYDCPCMINQDAMANAASILLAGASDFANNSSKITSFKGSFNKIEPAVHKQQALKLNLSAYSSIMTRSTGFGAFTERKIPASSEIFLKA